MKKTYFLLASLLTLGTSFGQVNQNGTLGSNANTNSTGSQTIASDAAAKPSSGGALTFYSKELPASSQVVSQENIAGHHTCKSHELTQQHYEEQGLWEDFNADYYQSINDVQSQNGQWKTPGTNTISVIFHVVHDNGDPVGVGTNVSYADIMAVFDDLVEDFSLTNADQSNARTGFGFIPANPGINFCLATQDEMGNPLAELGVERVGTNEDWYDSDGGEENKMKSSATGGADIWDRNDYLNIWICDISNGAGSGTAGYAYRPTMSYLPNAAIDGIVLDYNLGINSNNVLTHEVGHYLGLDHTWGGSGSCSMDDGFTDTPNTGGPFYDISFGCPASAQYCAGIETQYENYMDYSNCSCMFTQEQSDFMVAILQGPRASLLLSPGCDPTNTPPNSAFTSSPVGPTIIPQGGQVTLIDESTNAPTGWTWVISGTQGVDWDFVNATTAASQDPQVEFYNVGIYDVTLTASNAFGADATPAQEIGYIEVVAPAAGTACDTLRNWDPADAAANGYYYYNAAWGYAPGTGEYCGGGGTCYGYQYAEMFTASATAEVRRVSMPFFIADDQSGTGTMVLHVYPDVAGVPGTVPSASETINIADIDEGFWNEFEFTTPATVTGNFWVGFELFYGGTQDTVLVGMTDTQAGGNDSYYIDINGFGWYDAAALGITGSIAMDVMLSNGPAPVADMTYSDTELCAGGDVIYNGSGSTNTTNYYWYQTDDPVTTVIDDNFTAGGTFNFAAPGNYRIYLFADGSCMTDAIYLPIIVNNPPSFSTSANGTSCGQNNGSIDVTGVTGGDGVNYEYSLDGVNYQAGATFNNLPSGTYDVYVRTPGDNCETMVSGVNVAASTPLSTTISNGQSICLGGSATITATGGNSYTWYDGGTIIQGPSATASLTVSPTTQTQYTVEISDGVCTSQENSTISVDPLDDASFDFFDFCQGSANAAQNIATPGGTFSFNPAPGDGATINPTTGEISNETLNTYTIEYSVADNCPNTSTEDVTVSLNDDPQFTTGDFCAGDVNAVSGIATPGGTFTYDGADASSINASTGVISNGVSGTTYNITYTTPAGACQSVSSPVSVTVNALPSVSAGADQEVCEGDQVTLSGSGASTYVWDNSVSNNVPFTPGVGTVTYTVTGTDANGCQNTDQTDVTVNAAPTINAGTDQIVCSGDQVTLSGSGGVSYTWDNGVTDGVAFTPSAGTTTYTVTGTDANGCTNTDMVNVTSNAGANVTTDAVTNDDGTSNGGIDITLGGGDPPYDVSWSGPNGFTSTDEDLTGLEAGDYTVTITDNSGCVTVEVITVLSTVGINDNSLEALVIYPNPTEGDITITLEGNFDYEITDARGRLIFKNNGNNIEQVNMGQYESGIYFVRIQQGDASVIKKVVLR